MGIFLNKALPMPVVASPGTSVSLSSILTNSFGSVPSEYTDFWISYYSAAQIQGFDRSFWKPGNPLASTWFVNGADIGSNQIDVSGNEISTSVLEAGNAVGPYAYITVPVSPNYAENITYIVNTVDPHVLSPVAGHGAPTPQDIVDTAHQFANYYGSVLESEECHNIAEQVAAATGATLPWNSYSVVPTENEEGGFWRIAYRGSDPNPVSHWQSLVKPGDIVRMDWTDPAPDTVHTTTVLSVNTDGTMVVYDNGVTGTAAVRTVTYDTGTIPSSITIYRLTTDDHYLINGSDLGETIVGTDFNDEIRPGAGNDSIDGGPGVDIAVYAGLRSQYQITALPNGSLNVTDLRSGSPDGTDTLSNVELLQFADRTLASNDLTTSRAERFFDSATGDHFYTLSPAEANQIRAALPTYHDEGAPWGTPDKSPNTIDVFRFFDAATGAHFLTTSTAERDHVMATLPSYHYEGVAFEAYSAPGDGTLTLERFFNTQTHLHHYAASAAETASILNGGAGPGWVDEGAGFIVHA